MDVVITSLKRKSRLLTDFREMEWKKIHFEHFGSVQNPELWKKKKFTYVAKAGRKLVGSINGDFMGGVMFIDQLIVSEDLRSKGIGRLLMAKAEILATANNIHKIYLHTGVGWRSVAFYKKLGFTTEAKIKYMWEKKDIWVMTKELQ
jgi:ribosomal protein S18 acetylase RimI-like enzyme